jgi:hypothetical protein
VGQGWPLLLRAGAANHRLLAGRRIATVRAAPEGGQTTLVAVDSNDGPFALP